MEKHFVLDAETNEIEYVITSEEDTTEDTIRYKLYTSNNVLWSDSNELILMITDHKSGMEITLDDDDNLYDLGYDSFCKLHILMTFIRKNDSNLMSKYNYISALNFQELV